MKHTAKSRWALLDAERQPFLDKCEELSALTLPYICPPKDYDCKKDTLANDWQSAGSMCVTNLSNKLHLALCAPSRNFFRLTADKSTVEMMEMNAGIKKQTLEEILSLAEKESNKMFETLKLRPKVIETITHSIVIGNCLTELRGKSYRNYEIRKWLCKRDAYNEVHELMIRESLQFSTLEKDIKALDIFGGKTGDDLVELYRWIKKDDNGDFIETRWVDDKALPKKFNGKYPKDKIPYHITVWTLPDGQDYAVGHVEKVVGSFKELSVLSKARTQVALGSSEFRWVVNTSGQTSPEDFEKSENGAVIPGDPNDIALISSQMYAALAPIDSQISQIKTELSRFFLVGSGQTRDAERVTAQEIRMQVQELEVALGGAYTNIANDFLTPLANFLLSNLENPVQVKKGLKLVIITGLDALSRNGDIDSMNTMLQNLGSITALPPELLQQFNVQELIKFYANNYGIDTKQLLLTPEQVATNQQMQQQAQMNGAQGPSAGSVPTPTPEGEPQ